LPHKEGKEMDYPGMTVPITNCETGEVSQAPVFVATLPANCSTGWQGMYAPLLSLVVFARACGPDKLQNRREETELHEPDPNRITAVTLSKRPAARAMGVNEVSFIILNWFSALRAVG
jgi:hypothetical protein